MPAVSYLSGISTSKNIPSLEAMDFQQGLPAYDGVFSLSASHVCVHVILQFIHLPLKNYCLALTLCSFNHRKKQLFRIISNLFRQQSKRKIKI